MSFLWFYLFCFLLPLFLHILNILSCLISRTLPSSQELYPLAMAKSSLEKWKSPRNYVYMLSVRGASMKKPSFWSPIVIKLSCWQTLPLHPEWDPKILFRSSESMCVTSMQTFIQTLSSLPNPQRTWCLEPSHSYSVSPRVNLLGCEKGALYILAAVNQNDIWNTELKDKLSDPKKAKVWW